MLDQLPQTHHGLCEQKLDDVRLVITIPDPLLRVPALWCDLIHRRQYLAYYGLGRTRKSESRDRLEHYQEELVRFNCANEAPTTQSWRLLHGSDPKGAG
jgi:hypothetical protein